MQTARNVLSALTVLMLCVPLAAQGNGPGGPQGPGGNPQGGGNGKIVAYIGSLPLQTVDAAERAELLHMRQEEKLARDVYRTLYQAWSVPAFDNIAKSEQAHMDLVALILNRYGIPDPLPSNQVGVFADPLFTDLYNIFVAFGTRSQLNAEIVGCVIEDLDIFDLDFALAGTDNRDMGTVWQNLQRGSRNHMRAFYGLIENRGFVYPGFFLDAAAIQAIVNSPRETQPVDENGVPLP